MFPTAEDIVTCVRTREAEITKAYPSTFEDPQHRQVWAVVYAGLEVWAAALTAAGIPWFPPDIASFVRDVIAPVEASMWESVELPVEAFRSWWAMWRAKNTVLHGSGDEKWESPKGKGDIWEEGEVEVGMTVTNGTWVTKPVLMEYNKQAAPDLRIPTLSEVAKMVATAWGMPEAKMFDRAGKVPVQRFGQNTARAAFVPDSEAFHADVDDDQATLNDVSPTRVYLPSKPGNRVTSDLSKGENSVTHQGNMLHNKVTPDPSIEVKERYPVTQKAAHARESTYEPQSPERCAGCGGLVLPEMSLYRTSEGAVYHADHAPAKDGASTGSKTGPRSSP